MLGSIVPCVVCRVLRCVADGGDTGSELDLDGLRLSGRTIGAWFKLDSLGPGCNVGSDPAGEYVANSSTEGRASRAVGLVIEVR